jgi:hypothetical protein
MPLKADPFASGGPFHCSGILQLPPQDAERELANRGIRVSWRYETRLATGMGESILHLEAPKAGWISDTKFGSDGELIVFVQNPAEPMANPIAFPKDCPAPSPG